MAVLLHTPINLQISLLSWGEREKETDKERCLPVYDQNIKLFTDHSLLDDPPYKLNPFIRKSFTLKKIIKII